MVAFRFACACVLALTLGSSASAAITVTDFYVSAWIEHHEPFHDAKAETWHVMSQPTATATLNGHASIATNTVSITGNNASFVSTFNQSREGAALDSARGWTTVIFTTDVDVPFQFIGTYTNSAGYTDFFGGLYDYSVGLSTYYGWEAGQRDGGPFTYALDGSATRGTEYSSGQSGGQSGILKAGVMYQWDVTAFTNAWKQGNPLEGLADGGATAYGSVSLLIGDPINSTVPEPGSLIVWSILGIVGVVAFRRRRKSA